MLMEQAVEFCWASTDFTPSPMLCVCKVSASNQMYTAAMPKNYHSPNNPGDNYNST